jgi:hypothetical protein
VIGDLAPTTDGKWITAGDTLREGEAIDLLETHAPVSARKLLQRFAAHVRTALEDVGDYDMVNAGAHRLRWQRRDAPTPGPASTPRRERRQRGPGGATLS